MRQACAPETAEIVGAQCLGALLPEEPGASDQDGIRRAVALRLLSLAIWDLRQVRRAFSRAD